MKRSFKFCLLTVFSGIISLFFMWTITPFHATMNKSFGSSSSLTLRYLTANPLQSRQIQQTSIERPLMQEAEKSINNWNKDINEEGSDIMRQVETKTVDTEYQTLNEMSTMNPELETTTEREKERLLQNNRQTTDQDNENPRKDFIRPEAVTNDTRSSEQCPDILSGMTTGHWMTRPLNTEEESRIDQYLQDERRTYRIPRTYQRDDGLCGNVSYKYSPLYKHMWFKAICDPKGTTPCCHTTRCIAASESECQCPTCYDERQAIHAEFADWTPSDQRCKVKQFNSSQACELLRGSTIHFVGDSFVRHIFAATVVVLTGNTVDGALRKGLPSHLRNPCLGMHQITGVTCRDLLEQDRVLCNGTVKVQYTQVFPAREFNLTTPLLRSLRHVNKSVVIMSLGIHDNFSVRDVVKWFLLPFLNLRQTLSTNLTSNPDLYQVLTNFGNFKDNATDFAPNSEDIYSESNFSAKGNDKPNYEYLFQRPEEAILSDIGNPARLFNMNRGAFPYQGDLLKNGNIFKDDFNVVYPRNQGIIDPTFKTHLYSTENNNLIKANTVIQQSGDRIKREEKPPREVESDHPIGSEKESDKPLIFEALPKAGIDVNHLWPRLLWVGVHAPGLLKSFKFKEQTAEGVEKYNRGIQEILKLWKVPYLDTFSFSQGTVSFDGTHYGWGINMLKVNMLLTYIHDILAREESWR